MSALPAAKRQQILDLIAEDSSDRHIACTVGVGVRTVCRYRAGIIPAKPGAATDEHCSHGHPYPANRGTRKNGENYCTACRREQTRAWDQRNPRTNHKAKPAPSATSAAPRPTPPPLPAHGDWRTYAACRGEDPELFFPIGKTAAALRQTEAARAVCYRCPALEACARWALDTGQQHGVWGGYDEREIAAIRRKRARRRSKNRRDEVTS